MLKLGLKNKHEWIDLALGVRVKVKPITTSLMLSMRRSEQLLALAETEGEMPDEEIGLIVAKEMAKAAILDWEGVGDADGKPIPVSDDAIEAVMEVFPIFDAFQEKYVSHGLLVEREIEQEKNASALSPNGSSAGARNTAKRAGKPAKTARKR